MPAGIPGTPGSGSEMRGVPRPPSAEQAPVPDASRENEPQPSAPAEDAGLAVAANAAPAGTPTAPAKAAPAPVPTKDELRLKVERVLEENLWELYFALPKDARERFRAAGEKVAAEMRRLIDEEKVKPAEVHSRVDHWLKTIPKVNPWFLLQEGKIKTDNVLALARLQHPPQE